MTRLSYTIILNAQGVGYLFANQGQNEEPVPDGFFIARKYGLSLVEFKGALCGINLIETLVGDARKVDFPQPQSTIQNMMTTSFEVGHQQLRVSDSTISNLMSIVSVNVKIEPEE